MMKVLLILLFLFTSCHALIRFKPLYGLNEDRNWYIQTSGIPNCTFFPSRSQFEKVFKPLFKYEITYDNDKPFGALIQLDSETAIFNVHSSPHKRTCSDELPCVCQHMTTGSQKYRYGKEQFDYIKPLNVEIVQAYDRYATKTSFAAITFLDCQLPVRQTKGTSSNKMSASQCSSYAEFYGFRFEYQHDCSRPTGCLFNNKVFFNDCVNDATCSEDNQCIHLDVRSYYTYDQCVEVNGFFINNQKLTGCEYFVTRAFVAPDNSLSESECSSYALQHSLHFGTTDNLNLPQGCIRNETNALFNSNENEKYCGISGYDCVQKILIDVNREKCNEIGSVFHGECRDCHSLKRHFIELSASIAEQDINPIQTKNVTYLMDIFGSPTTQKVLETDYIKSYTRSAKRVFVGKQTSLTDRNKAVADCAEKCKGHNDCNFLSLTSTNECMLYRKCEQTNTDSTIDFFLKSNGPALTVITEDECSQYASINNLNYFGTTDGPLQAGLCSDVRSCFEGDNIGHMWENCREHCMAASPKGCVFQVLENRVWFNTLQNYPNMLTDCGSGTNEFTVFCVEATSSNFGVETFRKVGIDASKESSYGNTKEGVFHDVTVESFLCRNYREGKRLHNFFFDQDNTNSLLIGSSFTYNHALTDIWPSQSYVHFDNRIWIGTHPSKSFLKYSEENEAYIAYLKDISKDDLQIGRRFGFEQDYASCTYHLERQDCIDYANNQLLSIGDMDMAGKEMFYIVTQFDTECPAMSLSEDQCNEYRTLNGYVGGTVSAVNNIPPGCSVRIDAEGTSVPEVTYNPFKGTSSIAGFNLPYVDGSVQTFGVCYGNGNRLNPKGCFKDSKNNINFNNDVHFSDCSSDKTCICSFGIDIFNVVGGIKESMNEELCASVCADDEECNYLQIHESVCYGLATCDVVNDYEWKLHKDWVTCNEVVPPNTLLPMTVDFNAVEESLNQCALKCGNDGYSSDFVYVTKATADTYDFTLNTPTYSVCPSSAPFVFHRTGHYDACCSVKLNHTLKLSEDTSDATITRKACRDFALQHNYEWNVAFSDSNFPRCFYKASENKVYWNKDDTPASTCSADIQCIIVNYEETMPFSDNMHDRYHTCAATDGHEICVNPPCRDFASNALTDRFCSTPITAESVRECSFYNKLIYGKPSTYFFTYDETTKKCYSGKCSTMPFYVNLATKVSSSRDDLPDLTLTEDFCEDIAIYTKPSTNVFGYHESYSQSTAAPYGCVQQTRGNSMNGAIIGFQQSMNSFKCDRSSNEVNSVGCVQLKMRWEEKNTCSCMRDSCPSQQFFNNFTTTEWNQVYLRQVSTKATSSSKVFKVTKKSNFFQLFQYNGFWDCDAITYSDITDAEHCAQKTKDLNHYVFSYNDYNKLCLVYTHHTADAHDQLLKVGDYADWCYKERSLQGHEAFNLQYGICSDASITTKINTEATCIMREKDVVFDETCFDWKIVPSDTSFDKGSILGTEYYENIILAYEACLRSPQCNYIVEDKLYNVSGRYTLYEEKHVGKVFHTMVGSYTMMNRNCSRRQDCREQVPNDSFSFEMFENNLRCFKGFNPYHCKHSKFSVSTLHLTSFNIFECSSEDVHWQSHETNTGTLMECENFCRNSNCNITQYYYDSRTCYYGIGHLIDGNVNALTCTYNREKEEFLNYVPQQKCKSDHTFTPVSDPSLDNFKSYMLGNVKFNVGGTACVDCPKGQFPVTTFGYDCKVGIKKNMECAGDPALPSPCQFGVREVSLQVCKDECDKKGTTCQFISFVTNSNFELGTCYLFSGVTITADDTSSKYMTCEKVQLSSECAACSAGKYLATSGQTSCQNCGIGQYQDETGQASCKACAAQTYQDETGKTSCKNIDKFKYRTEKDNSKINRLATLNEYLISFGEVDNKESCLELVGEEKLRFMVYDTSSKLCEGIHERSDYTFFDSTALLDSFTHFELCNVSLTTNNLDTSDLSEEECEFYSNAIKKSFSSVNLENDHPKGCSTFGNTVFYNSNTDTQVKCDQSTKTDGCFMKVPCTSTVTVIEEAKKVCIGNLLVGAASGPLQDNIITDTPGTRDGGTELCEGCANFTIEIPGTDECQGCVPGYFFTELPFPRCDICQPGFYRNTEPPFAPFNTYDEPYYQTYDVATVWPDVGTFIYRCQACEPGKYAPEEGAPNCLPCPTGKYGTSWMQTSCLDCPTGQFMDEVEHYKALSDTHECKTCPKGKATNTVGNSQCFACEIGTYADVRGLAVCIGCAEGRFLGTVGGTKALCGSENEEDCCQVCKAGYGTNLDFKATECTACDLGTYQTVDEGGVCLDCSPGTYANAIGTVTCTNCPKGSSQPATKSTYCVYCVAGKFADVTGLANCKNCPTARYLEASSGVTIGTEPRERSCKLCNAGKQGTGTGKTSEATACTNCNPGTYNNNAGQMCKPCNAGQFQDGYGATSCKPCAAGSFGPGMGLSSCTLCSTGRFKSVAGSSSACSICGFGTQAVDRVKCEVCPNGQATFHQNDYDVFATGTCKNCEAGYFTESSRAIVYYGNEEASYGKYMKKCEACYSGLYQDQTGQSSCKACNQGYYCPNSAQTSRNAVSYCHVSGGNKCWQGFAATYASFVPVTERTSWRYSSTLGAPACHENKLLLTSDIYGGGRLFTHHKNGCTGQYLSQQYLNNFARVDNYIDGFNRCRQIADCKIFQLVDTKVYFYKDCCVGYCSSGGYYTFRMTCEHNYKYHWDTYSNTVRLHN